MSEKFGGNLNRSNEVTESNKYENVLTIDYMTEGGFKFLHRIFRTYFETGEPVIIKTGKSYFKYEYDINHTTFSEGVTLLEGDNDITNSRFMDTVNVF